MSEPRWDLIHDAVISDDDEPEGCRHVDPTGEDRECFCLDAADRASWLDEQDALGSDCA